MGLSGYRFAINKRGQQQSLHHKLPKYVTSIQVDSLVTVFANFQSFLQSETNPTAFLLLHLATYTRESTNLMHACLVQACIKLPNSSLNITFYTCQRCSCNDLQCSASYHYATKITEIQYSTFIFQRVLYSNYLTPGDVINDDEMCAVNEISHIPHFPLLRVNLVLEILKSEIQSEIHRERSSNQANGLASHMETT